MDTLSLDVLIGLGLALALAGCVTGFLAGLFGIGGGGIMVPILFEVFRYAGVDEAIRMHVAVGTALAAMIPTSLSSLRSHHARGNVDLGIIQRMALPVVAGVLVGSLIAKVSHSIVLTGIWIVFAILMAAKQFVGSKSWRLGDHVPRSRLLEVYGLGVGIISTLMSIGGGAYITTMMTLYGRPIQQAVGTSSGFGPMIALPGMIGFIWAGWSVAGTPPGSVGYVNLLGALAMVPMGVVFAPLGVRVASGMSRRHLEIGFGIFLVVVATKFVFDAAVFAVGRA
ncbi:MAG: sulfite exporter TauE/SafE family protein [Pseudomonadota bacterium]